MRSHTKVLLSIHMEKQQNNKEKLKKFAKRIGLISLAILWALAERGVFILDSMSGDSRRKSLRRSLDEINNLKTIDDYYEILKNLDKNTARTILWRLEKKGLIQKTKSGHFLTTSGKSFYENFRNAEKIKNSWDGKFRIVMFDVPESRKRYRDFIRQKLIRQEYSLLQKSVFIGKRPLEEDFAQWLLEKNLYQHLRIIIVGDIDDETVLKNLT